MADAVQQRVEAGLEELHALTQRQVLTQEETRQILRKRRDFEFECSSRHGDTVRAFLVYIHYEVNLLTLLRLRCRAALDASRSGLQQVQQQQRLLRVQQQQQKKKQKATRKERERLQRELQRQQQQEQRQQRRIARAKDLLHAVVRTGARRVYRLCRRLLQRHSTSLALWYSCLDLLLQLGSTRQLQQLLLHALRQFPCCSGLWILAADRLLQQGQLLAARRLLLTALRFNSTSVALWTELLRLEAAAALRKAEALNRQQHDQQQQQQDTPYGYTSLDSGGDVKTQQHETAVAPRAAAEKETTAAERKEAEEEGEGGEGGRATRRAPQVQGDVILVVLKAAVEKLGQRPRRPGSSRAAAAAAQEEAACNSRSNGGKLPVAVVDSRVQDFLLRALELCLGLQASKAAGLMQQLLLPPLQQQVSLLLHEQAQQQPLLRVYEWKVLLLQAVAADASAQAAEEAAEGFSSSDGSSSALDVSSRMGSGSEEEGCSGGNSNRKRKEAVCEVFESILKECEMQPHLLLLVALLLRALLASSSSKTPPATAAQASGEKPVAVATQEADEEIFCVFDVEGDAEAAAEGATSSSSGGTATKGGRGAATGTVSGAAGQLHIGAHLLQRYGGAHADADLLARYTAAGEEDNAAAAAARETVTVCAGVADQSATGGEAGKAVYDARALQLLEVLSEAGWPQVLLLLQRQPRLGRACLLLLQADVPTKEGAAGGTVAAAGDLLAGPQLLQLQRETLWTALWDAAAAVPAAEGKGQLHGQRLWLIESLLRALQQLHEHQQQQRTGLMKNGCTASKRSSAEQVTVAAAAAYGALGHVLLELLERAAAHVQASSLEDEVYGHLKPLHHVQQRLEQFTESFLKQQQQLEIDTSSLRKQHQQQVAQLLLLLLDIRKGDLLACTQQLQQQERCDTQRHQPVSKKMKRGRQAKTEKVEQKEQPQKATVTAGLDVLRKLNSSLGVAEAAGLLEHHLLLFSQEVRSCSSNSSKRLETEEDPAAGAVAAGREQGPVHELPVWFQDLLAAAAPAALPFLVQRFCQHGLMQVQQQMQEQLAQQQEDDTGVDNCFEGLISQQQHKRRKLVLGQRRQPPGSTATGSAAAEVEAKRRREVWWTEAFAEAPLCLPRGWPSPIPAEDVAAVARVAAVLQWTSSCVSSLNESSCCMRLCSAARLTVFTEVCNSAIQALWHSIARCWVSAAAAAPSLLGEAASDWWSETLVALLQQTREVYACALAVFERCGMQQQLPVQDERGGRGRRLQQQEEVLRRHVLQHVTNATQQQVQWWVDFWRFTRFCEEAAGLLQLHQSSRSRLPQSRAPAVARPARERYAAKDLTAASFFGVEKREETERQAEQALGEGSAALVAFREAVAAEVAAPCELQSHYPGGCTACGASRLWCTYTVAAHATTESHAASGSSTKRVL